MENYNKENADLVRADAQDDEVSKFRMTDLLEGTPPRAGGVRSS
jgi:hypothetical protein